MNLHLCLDDCYEFCESLDLDWSVHKQDPGWRARIYEPDRVNGREFGGYAETPSGAMISATQYAIEHLCNEALRPRRTEL